MSARQPRFEIVRGDHGYWARFIAANGRTVWVTETYTTRRAAARAISGMARAMSPAVRIWFAWTWITRNSNSASELRFGHPGDTYATAHRIEVRHIDERTAP